MYPLISRISCLLCFCLWIANSFASSSDDRDGNEEKKSGPEMGHLMAKAACEALNAKRKQVIEALQLFPAVLDSIVADYAKERYIFEPWLIREFEYLIHNAILADVLVLFGRGGDGRDTTHFYNLLEPVQMRPLELIWDANLHSVGVYHGVHVFVTFESDVIFRQTDGDMQEFIIPKCFGANSQVTVAPRMSDNGLIYLYDGNVVVLVNVARMIRTSSAELILYNFVAPEYTCQASLNPAGTVLVYLNDHKKVSICHVECNDVGKIAVDKRLTIEEHPAKHVLPLKNNTVAIVTDDDRIFFYSFDVDAKTSKCLGEGPSFANLKQPSYHVDEDVISALVVDEKQCSQGFYRMEPLFDGTRILTLCPEKCGMKKGSEYKVSEDLGYLVERNRDSYTSCVYRISEQLGHSIDKTPETEAQGTKEESKEIKQAVKPFGEPHDPMTPMSQIWTLSPSLDLDHKGSETGLSLGTDLKQNIDPLDCNPSSIPLNSIPYDSSGYQSHAIFSHEKDGKKYYRKTIPRIVFFDLDNDLKLYECAADSRVIGSRITSVLSFKFGKCPRSDYIFLYYADKDRQVPMEDADLIAFPKGPNIFRGSCSKREFHYHAL